MDYLQCKGYVPPPVPPSSDVLHGVLDFFGMIPIIGEVFDVANALLYASEGDFVNAAVSMAAILPIVGSVGTGGRLAKKVVSEVVEEVEQKAVRDISENMIERIDRSLLDPPKKHGNAPTFKKDGRPVEIHHVDQNPNGPFKEMHWEDHRGKGNNKTNHPNKESKIDRDRFKKEKKNYWKQEYPKNN